MWAKAPRRQVKKKHRPANQPLRLLLHPTTRNRKKRRSRLQKKIRSMGLGLRLTVGLVCIIVIAAGVTAQSRHSSRYGDMDGTIVNVVATRTDSKKDPIRVE